MSDERRVQLLSVILKIIALVFLVELMISAVLVLPTTAPLTWEVTPLPNSVGLALGSAWCVVPLVLVFFGGILLYIARLWRAASDPLAHGTLLDVTRIVCLGQLLRGVWWFIEGRLGSNTFYYVAMVVIAAILLALLSWLRPRSAVKPL